MVFILAQSREHIQGIRENLILANTTKSVSAQIMVKAPPSFIVAQALHSHTRLTRIPTRMPFVCILIRDTPLFAMCGAWRRLGFGDTNVEPHTHTPSSQTYTKYSILAIDTCHCRVRRVACVCVCVVCAL